MESNLVGVFCIFVFNAISMLILCPSRYGTTKTVAIWSGVTIFNGVMSYILIRCFASFGGGMLTFGVATDF